MSTRCPNSTVQTPASKVWDRHGGCSYGFGTKLRERRLPQERIAGGEHQRGDQMDKKEGSEFAVTRTLQARLFPVSTGRPTASLLSLSSANPYRLNLLRFFSDLTPASKVLCPLDFVALAVLPHGQIVGFCGVFWIFDGCIRFDVSVPVQRELKNHFYR